MLVRNALGVTALSSTAAHDIQDRVCKKQEISNASSVASQADLCSQQHLLAFPSSVIPDLQESQHMKTFSQTRDYCREELAHVDCYGNTPLHYAVGVYGHLKMYRICTDVITTVEFLVKCGANINAQNKEGLTPLHLSLIHI